MSDRPPRRRRARPVADAPVEALVLRAEDLTKGWLLALLEDAPLEHAPAMVAADLVRDGPRVCVAVVQALASDEDMRRLGPGGALELLASQAGAFALAHDAESICRAVDALHAVMWAAVRDELVDPDADQVAELTERLGLVMELVRGASLRREAAEVTGAAGVTGAAEVTSAAGAAPAVIAPTPDPEPASRFSAARLSEVEPACEVGSAVASTPAPASWPPRGASAAGMPGEVAGRSARTHSQDTLWIGALDDEVLRAERMGTPLSLLLVELEDAERVVAADGGGEAAAAFGRFAQAVRGAARRQDILACESDARAWVIARDTPRPGARALGERIVSAVREAHRWRGAPLTVNLGLSVFGEDARDGDGLIQAAEQAMFAAAASGSELAEGNGAAATPSEKAPDGPGGPGPEFVS